MQMAETIFGPGVTVQSASYSGDRVSSGIYSNGDSITPGVTPSDSGVILTTGRVQNFTQGSGDPNRSASTSYNSSGQNDNAQFNALVGGRTYDAAILTTNFIPTTDMLTIQFVFASEEYPEFSGSIYNDAVGVWINGQVVTSPVVNIAQINSINQSENETLFVNNTGDAYNTEMDGFTVTLSLLIPVNIGVLNTLTIGIADVADSGYDSAVLIAANSVQGEFIAQDDTITLNELQVAQIDVLANDGNGVGVAVITHINGIAVGVGDTVTLSNGHQITLMADGTLQIVPPGSYVNLSGPVTANFSYTAQSASGITDTAFVSVTTVPCFTPGTRIRTDRGEVPVETLKPGDLVKTRDHGFQPVRWIGERRVAAEGAYAPVAIEAGVFGHHRRLVVSQQHRILLTHWMAELLFGEDEVLVAARDLVNGCSVRLLDGGEVTYVHLLFDQHEIVWSEGLLTESFLPGPTVMSGMEAACRAEVLELFPGIDAATHEGYGPAARAALRGYEGQMLRGVAVA
ncbi:Hint domain-containing protein [Roseicyclus marinus]|uniref:Hint domain-containing protein n=2 Tax=Roseicyclus marinus TaxID=2161673 RepID=UPI00240EF52B|nr:Hint domain-containing protein [Roseicyclus marinus]MDG3041196.1 Hint domain-containing protein [Roseicyclus marinus]